MGRTSGGETGGSLTPSGDTTGTTDTAAINAASLALFNTGGGTLSLAQGIFWVTQVLIYAGVRLTGVSRGSPTANAQSAKNGLLGTVLMAPIGNIVDMLAFAKQAGAPIGWVIEHLQVNGNNASSGQSTQFNAMNLSGLTAGNTGTGSAAMPKQGLVQDVMINVVPGSGIVVTPTTNGSMGGCHFRDIQMPNVGLHGVSIASGVADYTMTNVDVEISGWNAFNIVGSHGKLIGCKSNTCGQLAGGPGLEDGFSIVGSSNVLEGCEAENAGQGGAGSHGNNFGIYGADNRIYGSSMTPVQTDVYEGVPVTASTTVTSVTSQGTGGAGAVLVVGSTTGMAVGQLIKDTTTAAAIPAGVTVAAINTGTSTITLSVGVTTVIAADGLSVGIANSAATVKNNDVSVTVADNTSNSVPASNLTIDASFTQPSSAIRLRGQVGTTVLTLTGGAQIVGAKDIATPLTTLNPAGLTGSCYAIMRIDDNGYKRVTLSFNSFTATGTGTYTFPVAFLETPTILVNDVSPSLTPTITTAHIVTPITASSSTGVIQLGGY